MKKKFYEIQLKQTLRDIMRLHDLYHQNASPDIQEFRRYIIAGLINTLASFVAYVFCIKILKFPFLAANFAAMVAGIICGFYLSRNYVFTIVKGDTSVILPKYILTMFTQFIVSSSLIALFRQFGINDIFSYIISLPIVVLLSFALQKAWVFKSFAKYK